MRSCWNCEFYVGNQYSGRCHRFPPDTGGEFAAVTPEDWCGEFVLINDRGIQRRLDAPGAGLVDRFTALTFGDKAIDL